METAEVSISSNPESLAGQKIDAVIRQALLARLEQYRDISRLSEATIGNKSCGASNLFKRLREAQSITLDRCQQVNKWLDENWPAGGQGSSE